MTIADYLLAITFKTDIKMPEFSQINSNIGLERYYWSENDITLIIILVVESQTPCVNQLGDTM